MQYRIFTTVFSSLLALIVAFPATGETQTLGRTYAIAEPDAITEIQQRASKIDWEGKARSIDLRASIRKGSVKVPVATVEVQYPLDLTYTLPFDIPDGKGGVLYPKGYRFNPVAFVHIPYRLGVIGTRPSEIAWAKRQKGAIVWMTAGGDPLALTEKLNMQVYLYTPQMAKRLPVRGTPALIAQQGDKLVVSEYVVRDMEAK